MRSVLRNVPSRAAAAVMVTQARSRPTQRLANVPRGLARSRKGCVGASEPLWPVSTPQVPSSLCTQPPAQVTADLLRLDYGR